MKIETPASGGHAAVKQQELSIETLIEENRNLKERLFEAEQTIQAIQSGEVDALVINEPGGVQLYTLTGADHGYRVLVESITEGALILSSDDSIYYCNRSLREMLGLPIQKIIGTELDSYVMFFEGRAQLSELINECRDLGTAKGELLLKRNDGTLLPVNISLNRMSFEEFEGVCAVITDLSQHKRIEEELRRHRSKLELLVNERTADLATKNAELQQEIIERKRMEKALRESQERFEALAEASFEGIGFTEGGVVIDANPQLAQMLRYDLSEIIGKPVAEMIAPEDRELVRQFMDAGYEGLYENRLLRKDSSTLVVETQAKHFAYRGHIVRVTAVRDITDRKHAEEALRESEERFRVAQELSPDGFTILRPVRDPGGQIVDFTWVYQNAAIARMNSTDTKEVLGRRLLDLMPGHLTSPFLEAYKHVAETGETRVLEAQYHGDSILNPTWFRVAVVPMENDIAILAQDITERKRIEAELRQSHAELELKVQERTAELQINNRALMDYAAKLEKLNQELEDFAFVASHDLQEPLRKIQTFGSMLMKDHKGNLDEQAQAHLLRITGSAKRMSDSLHSLLNYSLIASQPRRREIVDLKTLAQGIAGEFEFAFSQAGGKIEIGNLPEVEADSTQIRHLLQSLIDNSIKYCKDAQSPLVKIHGEESGGTCSIFVEDNGIGFDERYLDLIFKPFQQLHGRGKYEGTGMGLALCRKIVERHDGSITARSIPGQGSTFIVRLPSTHREKGRG